MIVYRELSSLQVDLGISLKTLYTLSNEIRRHYRPVSVPKGNGEVRRLTVPDRELKSVQKRIAEVILPIMPISPYAMAYRVGGSPLQNASCHVGKPRLLKLDIRHFFDNIIYSTIREYAFPEKQFSEEIRTLLSLLCSYKDTLPQGAPTSPAISNIIMKGFDDYLGNWCGERNITYTRYCDDMTFSGDFDTEEVIEVVRHELKKLGLYLNDKKTIKVHDGQRKIVTGIVVNEKVSVSSSTRKKIRQNLHYCMNYGIESHMKHADIKISKKLYLQKLLGQVNYVLSVTPNNNEFLTYKNWLTYNIKLLPSE